MTTEVAPAEPGAQPDTPAGWYPEPGQPPRSATGTEPPGQSTAHPRVPGVQPPIVVTTPTRFRKTSHGFHLFLTIFTLGLWAPVWLIMSHLQRSPERLMDARSIDSAWEEFRRTWYADPARLGMNAREAFEAGWEACRDPAERRA
jgi:hypothetical protein